MRLRPDFVVSSESLHFEVYLKIWVGLNQGHGLRAVWPFVKKRSILLNKWVIFEQMLSHLKGHGLDKDQPKSSNIPQSVSFQKTPQNSTSASRQPQNGHIFGTLILHLMASTEAILRLRPDFRVDLDSPWVDVHFMT